MAGDAIKKYATLGNLIFVLATIQLVWLVWFFYTGKGGGAGAGRARAADRADAANPVHVPGRLSLQAAAAVANQR